MEPSARYRCARTADRRRRALAQCVSICPCPKGRTHDAYYVPLETLKLGPETELYLGLIHHDDAEGDATRLAAARRHARVDGIATECGMARGDPARLPGMLAAHARAAEIAP